MPEQHCERSMVMGHQGIQGMIVRVWSIRFSPNKADLQPGDLVFFKNRNKIDHVAIVSRVSRNKTWLIHSTTSQGVVETPLEDSVYWRPRVVTYRSIIHH